MATENIIPGYNILRTRLSIYDRNGGILCYGGWVYIVNTTEFLNIFEQVNDENSFSPRDF